MTKNELNKQLLDVCLAKEIDYARAEELLRQGAEPLGRIDGSEHPENLYTAVIDELYLGRDDVPEDLWKITELFLRYGMDIAKPSVPYDSDVLNPLRTFGTPSVTAYSVCPDASAAHVLHALKLLLDYGLRAEDARECRTEYLDMIRLACEPDDPYDLRIICDYLRKLMLIASYPHVLDADADLREEIRLAQNDYDPTRFRNWQDFTFSVDTSRCENAPCASRSVVTVIEKSSGKTVWTLGVGLQPEEAF